MRLLLDTHAFLWYVWDDPKLSTTATDLIENSEHEKFVSLASVWEMAIKTSTGKLVLQRPFDQMQNELIAGNGFEELPITFAHAVRVSDLPFLHKDPFDRLLVAQSLAEDMPLISAETLFDQYGVKRFW